MRVSGIASGWLAVLLITGNACGQPAALPLNPGNSAYASQPAMAVADDGVTWFAWQSYGNGREQIRIRRIDEAGRPGEVEIISGEGAVHGEPVIVAGVGRSTWVIWTALSDGRWRVVAREWRNDGWQVQVEVSGPEADAIFPTAEKSASGELIVAWSSGLDQRFCVNCRALANGEWGDIQTVSSRRNDAYRPAIAATNEGAAWIFWDEYGDGSYSIRGREILPTFGEIEQVSPSGEYCLKPAALATDRGVHVAWLRKQDVIGGAAVISQWHTLHAATRTESGWDPIVEENGSFVAAELTQGLVAKIEPQPVATGGYLGRRTAPMLLNGDEQVWLLWERKADHQGSTGTVTGDLLARPIDDGQWGETQVAARGQVDYHLADPRTAVDGQFTFVASNVPQTGLRFYRTQQGDLTRTEEFHQDEWTGWDPVELPIEDELPPRREIDVGGTTLQLYWADLHCHSRLSADAEGEPDELNHYARDRAGLDVVLFSDNDYYLVPMTESEYELGNLFARVHSRPLQFLSLQGYEWTSRIPGLADADPADRGNWTPPYRNRSFPNHRTVIYPDGGGPIVRFPEVENDIARLNRAVAEAGGLTLTQHQVFQSSGSPVEVAMEVTAGWRRYIETNPDSFHRPLQDGLRLGFVANGDSHRRAPGLSGALTGIYAEELTTDAILEALRSRRCYATNGSRIFVDARANDAVMGRDVSARNRSVTLSLSVIGTRPIVSATLVRDGEEIEVFEGDGRREFELSYTDEDLSSGTHWYYWRIAQERSAAPLPGNLMTAHGHLAWSTPHWVNVE